MESAMKFSILIAAAMIALAGCQSAQDTTVPRRQAAVARHPATAIQADAVRNIQTRARAELQARARRYIPHLLAQRRSHLAVAANERRGAWTPDPAR